MLYIIRTGKDNAIHQNKLAKILGWKPCEVKKIIQKIRIDYNIIIVSDDSGYYFPETEDDIRKFYFMMKKQAIQRLKTIRCIRKYLGNCKGQEIIDGVQEERDG